MFRLSSPLLVGVFLTMALVAHSQPKTTAPKDTPVILVSLPLGVKPGSTTRLTLRGLKLDGATAVRCEPKGTAKVLQKNKVPVSNQQDPRRVGDSSVGIELTIPADVPGDTITLVVDTPGGPSNPYALALDRLPVQVEKEPNDTFKQAQLLRIGDTVEGKIQVVQDVDVYRFEAKAGQKVVVEVWAARRGSALDSFLTLFDDRGRVLDSCDDIDGSTDSRIEITIPKAGTYYASVMDANDQGGEGYVYRLGVRAK
jgi:hypothetical protein